MDNYRPVLEAVRADVEVFEDDVLRGTPKQADIERLYGLRRDLLRLPGAIVPLVEVCSGLEHAEPMAADPAMGPLFRDVTDHVRRVQEETDALREVLAFAFEASPMMDQAQQTAIARSLAARRLQGAILTVQAQRLTLTSGSGSPRPAQPRKNTTVTSRNVGSSTAQDQTM